MQTAEAVSEDVKNPAVQCLWNVRNIFNAVQEKDSWIKEIWIGNKNHGTKFHKEYGFLGIGMLKMAREVQSSYIFPSIFTLHTQKAPLTSTFSHIIHRSRQLLTHLISKN